ncbi:unnamed protein product, partial [Peniophora sp. CBMAI 1063]
YPSTIGIPLGYICTPLERLQQIPHPLLALQPGQLSLDVLDLVDLSMPPPAAAHQAIVVDDNEITAVHFAA